MKKKLFHVDSHAEDVVISCRRTSITRNGAGAILDVLRARSTKEEERAKSRLWRKVALPGPSTRITPTEVVFVNREYTKL
jgi:hypothetical protein